MQPDPRWQRPPVPPVTGWWFLVPLFTCGFATPLMVLIGGSRLRSRFHQICAAGYLALIFVLCGLASVRDDGAETGFLSGLYAFSYLTLWIGGTAHTAVLQTQVRNAFFRYATQQYPPGAGPAPHHPGLTYYPQTPPAWHQSLRVDPALAAAQWRAARREEARQLQSSQPALASELMIGRPDLPGRQYDDGGLIDVNHVPADLMMRHLSIERPLAEQIVAARELHNGFTAPEELVVFCDGLTPNKLELFRDRLIFIPR
ncbi:ComEA family DNA-binding protein [Actinoplanes utahensis]|uniref:ComEA family DNA-binding protein n=1 Tax=Actinoplanes utahensis TaxID=1869 RepID=UPI00068CE4E7|nr:helix-hairpin-helix domain-containing protein [Actinoplanes utahensis]GIF28960.1 hypothetical protein Aut01nite_19460 [Actinoplanes utahensis]